MTASKHLLQIKYARIIEQLAERLHIPAQDAMAHFYNSDTYLLMSTGVSDFHCLSDGYLVEELIRELEPSQE